MKKTENNKNKNTVTIIKSLAIIATAATLLVFCGCSFGLGAMSDEEAIEILKQNAPIAHELETIVYGKGLEVKEREEGETARYVEVCEDCEYKSIDEIKQKLGRVYSKERQNEMWIYAFEGSDDYVSRYSTNTSGKLTRNVNVEEMGLLIEIYPETAKVKSSNKYSATLTLDAKRKGLSGEEEIYQKTVRLVFEDGNWVFDCALY